MNSVVKKKSSYLSFETATLFNFIIEIIFIVELAFL